LVMFVVARIPLATTLPPSVGFDVMLCRIRRE
jgi:hypothetical protein